MSTFYQPFLQFGRQNFGGKLVFQSKDCDEATDLLIQHYRCFLPRRLYFSKVVRESVCFEKKNMKMEDTKYYFPYTVVCLNLIIVLRLKLTPLYA